MGRIRAGKDAWSFLHRAHPLTDALIISHPNLTSIFLVGSHGLSQGGDSEDIR